MRPRRWLAAALLVVLAGAASAAGERRVAPGEAIQPLLDAAPPGQVIRLAAGRPSRVFLLILSCFQEFQKRSQVSIVSKLQKTLPDLLGASGFSPLLQLHL